MADACARSPERGALICGTETLTHAEYTRCVAAFAHRLIELGARGKRVAILLANSNDAAIAISPQSGGAQAVPLNPAYTASELGPILADAACKVIVCDVTVEPVVHATGADQAALMIVVGPNAERLTRWTSKRHWNCDALPARTRSQRSNTPATPRAKPRVSIDSSRHRHQHQSARVRAFNEA